MTDLDNLDYTPDEDLKSLEDIAPCHIHKDGEPRNKKMDVEELELMQLELGLTISD